MIMERIGKYMSYNEVIRSYTARTRGIDNTPDKQQLANIKILYKEVFEPVREYFGVPIFLPSVFRSRGLNDAIGGANGSQHMANKGAAMDMDADVFGIITNRDIFEYIRDNLEFDQLIYEFGDDNNPEWVHVSFNKQFNRKQILRSFRNKYNIVYYVDIT